MSALAGLSGRQRSALNALLKGGRVVIEADGVPRYEDRYGKVGWAFDSAIVDRLRYRGLIASDGSISDAGRELVTRRATTQEPGSSAADGDGEAGA